ncbi:hypothetical protein ID866_9929 [Astraeus odoratus]|nr:hypothetical protein ID866_9929 [Astraeus odoratus]
MNHHSGTSLMACTVPETSRASSSIRMGRCCAGTSSALQAAQANSTAMNAQAVETQVMECKTAPTASQLIAHLESKAITPYHPEAWAHLLHTYGLESKYPSIVTQLTHGFLVGTPSISCSFIPPNNASTTLHHTVFNELITKEFQKEHYIGPFSHESLDWIIGPFQSSLLTIIPKPGKPGQFRLIQNLSYPNAPIPNTPQLINSQVDSSMFPCTWGTFHTACTLIASLPLGCQGATRDIAEAY